MEQETINMEVMREQLRKSACGFEVIGVVIPVEVLSFWFGIGAALCAKMVNSLEELISRKLRLLSIKWQKNKNNHNR